MPKQSDTRQSDVILSLMDKDEFVYDQDDNLYVITVDEGGHRLIINPKSERYKGIISNRYNVRYKEVPDKSAHGNALLVKNGETTKKVRLYVRIAGENIGTQQAVIYYDLCNSGDAIQVKPSKDGGAIEIIPRPLKFKDTGRCGEQIKPNLDAKISDATKFYNHIKIKPPNLEPDKSEQQNLSEETIELLAMKDEIIQRRKQILLAWTIYNLIPDTPEYRLVRPGLKITGAPGSAKTMNSIKILSIPDPVSDEIKRKPDDLESLGLMLYQRWIPAFDNVNEIDQEESDMLCQAATGVSIEKRKRYTDDDMIKASFRRSCIINGVSDVLTRPDATDRYIPIELQRLDPGENKRETQVFKEYCEDLPDIWGACLKILSITLHRLAEPHDAPKKNHRLTDFLEIGRIIADIINPGDADEFEDEFVRMMKAQETSMIDTNVIINAVTDFIMNDRSVTTEKWSPQLTFKEFRDMILKDLASNELEGTIEYRTLSTVSPTVFRRELLTFKNNMYNAGVDFYIVSPTPGVVAGRSASYRLKYKRVDTRYLTDISI